MVRVVARRLRGTFWGPLHKGLGFRGAVLFWGPEKGP